MGRRSDGREHQAADRRAAALARAQQRAAAGNHVPADVLGGARAAPHRDGACAECAQILNHEAVFKVHTTRARSLGIPKQALKHAMLVMLGFTPTIQGVKRSLRWTRFTTRRRGRRDFSDGYP